MTSPVALYRPAATVIAIGGKPVTVAYGPVLGGLITNPSVAVGQGIETAEILYLDPTGAPAALEVTETTVAIQPGSSYLIPNQTTNVSVNAATSGHLFSGIVLQMPPNAPTAQAGVFPPSGPTTLSHLTLPAYPYQEYADDDDIQAFFSFFNYFAGQIIQWFVTIGLPIYTNPQISGPLLDWVANGLYGIARPALSSGQNQNLGPLNTYSYDTIALNHVKIIGPSNLTVTNDDIFKRIITWNFYKGDGNTFNVRWLKRRVARFLNGTNGSAPNIDETYNISVTYGPGIIAIRLAFGTRTITGGALCDRFGFNSTAFNAVTTQYQSGPNPPAYATTFAEALESGVLILPFQFQFSVVV